MSLDKYMVYCEGRAFKWGEFDCCHFAGGAIKAICGYNPMDSVAYYNDVTTASISLRERFGTTSVRDAFLQIADEYGAQRVENNDLKDGDILSVDFSRLVKQRCQVDQSFGMGVYWRNSIYVCLQPKGLARLGNYLTLKDAWRFT